MAGGQVHLEQPGFAVNAAAGSLTRPANTTAYSSGQLVGQNTNGSSVTPLQFTVARTVGGSFKIRRGRLNKSGTSTTNAAFRIHLFTVAPSILAGASNGDGATFATVVSGSANYLGYLDVTAMQGFADGCTGIGAPGAGSEITAAVGGSQTVYGLIEARGAYTPASAEVFTATLEAFQN